YAAQTRVISKRLLGGNVEVDHEDEWKRTLAVGPALLQILEMVPWYDFVTDAAVKKNLHTVIRYRLRNVDNLQAEAVRQVDARLSPCVSGSNLVSILILRFLFYLSEIVSVKNGNYHSAILWVLELNFSQIES
ncbi:unnamed protein product, partial [Rotaria magnacalcarata]